MTEEQAMIIQFNEWLANLERIKVEQEARLQARRKTEPKRKPCCDKPDYEETARCANCGAYLF